MATIAQIVDSIFNIFDTLPLYKHDIPIKITNGT